MPDKTISIEAVREWLVTGKDNPETLVDLKWQILDETKIDDKLVSFRVTHEAFPINLLVLDLEASDPSVKAIRLVIETGIKTVDMEKDSKLRLYRALLEGAKIPFVAYYLFGPDDEIGVAVDLDKRGLSKEEFELHLASLVMAYRYLAEVKELRDIILAETLMILYSLVARWINSGMTRDEIVNRLVAGGLDREIGEKLVDGILKEGSRQEEMEGGSLYI